MSVITNINKIINYFENLSENEISVKSDRIDFSDENERKEFTVNLANSLDTKFKDRFIAENIFEGLLNINFDGRKFTITLIKCRICNGPYYYIWRIDTNNSIDTL